MKATKLLATSSLLLLTFLSVPTQAAEVGQPIFNAKDLQGWQGMQGEATNWGVQDGVLTGTGGQGSQWLATSAEYDDFDLSLEFMLPQDGEWVSLRVRAVGNHLRTWVDGSPAADCRDTENRHKTGSILLQMHHRTGKVEFREVRIRRLEGK